MNSDRIKEIQNETGLPNSVSVQQALLTVWNECEQYHKQQTNAKVLEALEVEVKQAYKIGKGQGLVESQGFELAYKDEREYYEIEVKPKYEGGN